MEDHYCLSCGSKMNFTPGIGWYCPIGPKCLFSGGPGYPSLDPTPDEKRRQELAREYEAVPSAQAFLAVCDRLIAAERERDEAQELIEDTRLLLIAAIHEPTPEHTLSTVVRALRDIDAAGTQATPVSQEPRD